MATITAILRDQMAVRRMRLACGLVMFAYVALHLCMHALGNVSFAAMQGATLIHEAVWHNPVATVALYGAFAIHFSLALWALYDRRSFRMGAGELTRLVLGFSIVPLMVHHFVYGRYVGSEFEIARRYDVVLTTGGAPNQFLGDGVMAIFGMRSAPDVACAQALAAAQLVRARLTEMNRLLANELPKPIEIGVGLHAGTAILGEIGYRDRFVLTAIGDTVHVAARLQDLTKDFGCELVVSEAVAATARIDLGQFPEREVQVRGREAPLRVRLVRDMALVAA